MFQESIIDVKSLRAAVENQHSGSPQSDLEALLKEHDALLSVLRTVEKERDAFCKILKQAQAGLKSLEEEIRGKSKELDATVGEHLAANRHIVDAGNEIVERQFLFRQREIQQHVLEQKIMELETVALGMISKAHKENLDELRNSSKNWNWFLKKKLAFSVKEMPCELPSRYAIAQTFHILQVLLLLSCRCLL